MRGTFSASEIVAKERSPSVSCLLDERHIWKSETLTHGCNDLSFQAVLIRKSPSEIAHTASSITGNVGDFSDVVEHMTTCEEKDSNQANSSPEVAILNDGQKVWASNT
jgi:hypothetical protein